MKATRILLLFLLLIAPYSCSSVSTSAAADAITGTWRGEWGPAPQRQTEVTVEFKWDGKNLHGTVDPGGKAYEFTKASFDPQTNAVKMELDGPNSRREIVHYVIEGKISGKVMSGTFNRGGEKGTFRIQKR
jgi:hypothetical protein